MYRGATMPILGNDFAVLHAKSDAKKGTDTQTDRFSLTSDR